MNYFGQSQKRQQSKGFTLIEVMVALFILSLISFLLYSSNVSTLKNQNRVSKRDELFHEVSLSLQKMATDLEMTFLLVGPDFTGVNGNLKTVFSGKQESLSFVTFAHQRYFKDSREADFAEVAYSLSPNEEDRTLNLLMRRESKTVDDKPEEGGIPEALLEKVTALSFEYYDPVKKDWRREWDSSQVDYANRLPRAVRIFLEVKIAEDEKASFTTIAELRWSQGLAF